MMQQTPNPFVLGAQIVHVSTHWHRRLGAKAKIVKVTPTGMFKIEYEHGSQPERKYKGYWNGSGWYAEEVGGPKYSHSHFEPWSEKIEAEIDNAKKASEAHALRQAFIKRLEGFSLDSQENRNLLGRMIMAGKVDGLKRGSK